MRLFDSHAHIGSPDLYAEAPRLIERARQAGVEGILAVGAGYGLEHNAGALALAREHRGVWATAGVHPHEAEDWDDRARRAVSGWLGHPRVVAVGECGLDYWYEHSPREAQRECLRAQIRIARETGLPLVIHVRPSRGERDAYDELLRILDEEGAERAGGVIHCFTGDLAFARECLARSFMLSFSGILTFRNTEDLRAVARETPLERTLIETDSPLLAPDPHRGRRNEPAFVVHVAECLAAIHGVDAERVAEITAGNTYRLFRMETER
jgi:TatD DNase family protein